MKINNVVDVNVVDQSCNNVRNAQNVRVPSISVMSQSHDRRHAGVSVGVDRHADSFTGACDGMRQSHSVLVQEDNQANALMKVSDQGDPVTRRRGGQITSAIGGQAQKSQVEHQFSSSSGGDSEVRLPLYHRLYCDFHCIIFYNWLTVDG